MNFSELFEKYQALQGENNLLREENKRLKRQLGISKQQEISFEFSEQKLMLEMIKTDYDEVEIPGINNLSTPAEKVVLICSSLFYV